MTFEGLLKDKVALVVDDEKDMLASQCFVCWICYHGTKGGCVKGFLSADILQYDIRRRPVLPFYLRGNPIYETASV